MPGKKQPRAEGILLVQEIHQPKTISPLTSNRYRVPYLLRVKTNSIIKSYFVFKKFFKHKTNDKKGKIRRFGVVKTPLSRKNVNRSI